MTVHAGLWRTDGGGVPLRGVAVVGAVYGGHAAVTVRQRYHNTEPRPVEAVYTFPLPSDATLVGFAMSCEGRRIEGAVQEREAAFRQYDDALAAGYGVALLEQERANVFTASVGNLLPGEETLIEVQYVERLHADEGALRWRIPSLVAPRYIPGTPQGDRTGDGWAEPTARVPDADRITPRIGTVAYGLMLDLLFDVGSEISVESPSHEVTLTHEEGKRVRVSFTRTEVALDRDVVLTARGLSGRPLGAAVLHRPADANESGTLALTIVPDLESGASAVTRQDVVFLIDVSGSMQGASIGEVQTALRVCLRHLRAGDRFNVIAFQSTAQYFAPQPVPFSQQTLDHADVWVQALVADGGTELREPLVEAVRQVPDGVVMLLTDGQVGNEEEILREVQAVRGRARLYVFGIGTNVNDLLVRDLARHTGGAVEYIYPGERIDEKVVAQFARALAPRVTDVTVSFSGNGLEVTELAPSALPALVEGEPWELFARISGQGRGQAEVHGTYANAPFSMVIPIDFSVAAARPLLTTFWAAERIRDWETTAVTGLRAAQLKERMVALAVQYRIVSQYTSFLVVEQRTGERWARGQPTTRVIPVSLPAGWAMFGDSERRHRNSITTVTSLRLTSGVFHLRKRTEQRGNDPLITLLSRQLASGLWSGAGTGNAEVRQARATAQALRELLQAGVTTHHALYGAQVVKAVEALITLAVQIVCQDPEVAAFALGVAWLVAIRRTRGEIATLITRHAELNGLRPCLGDEQAVRTYVERHVPVVTMP